MLLYRNGNKTTYLSHQISNSRYWFSFLMADGCRTLSIPVFKFLNAFQVKKSLQSSAVVINNSEILILDCTAHLQNASQLSAPTWQRSIWNEQTLWVYWLSGDPSCNPTGKELQELGIIVCLILCHDIITAVQKRKGSVAPVIPRFPSSSPRTRPEGCSEINLQAQPQMCLLESCCWAHQHPAKPPPVLRALPADTQCYPPACPVQETLA